MPTSLQPFDSPIGVVFGFQVDSDAVVVDQPITVETLEGAESTHGYDTLAAIGDDAWDATARIALVDGTTLRIRDRLVLDRPGLRIDRAVDIERAGSASGIRIGLGARSEIAEARDGDWQYFIPCTLYNRNDSDGDGVEDYLGTYVQDHRDDKNGLLAVLGRHASSGVTVSLARTDVPEYDDPVPPEKLQSARFVLSTDIGSLGLLPRHGQLGLRASYPFSEEHSFCLSNDGRGWAAFLANTDGAHVEASYELRVSRTPDLTQAIWDIFRHQKHRLGTARPDPGITLAEAIDERQLLTQLYYRKWESAENAKEPAGYLVHFSPRTGKTQGSLIEFGFSGDQALLALVQMRWGYATNVPLYAQRARTVLDFFVRHCTLPNGFSQGIYDPIADRFTQWFTGILMPFQYADDVAQVREYVGEQMAEALMPVATELRGVNGNYLRTMCESFFPLALALELDARHGMEHAEWRQVLVRFGEFLLAGQAPDGSWFRAYDEAGNGLTSPAAWFGASYLEQKSGTIFPAPTLVALHRLTGEEKYLVAARRAAEFLIANYVEPVLYVGGLNDTTHIKSVKTDAVGIMFLMRSLLATYEATQERRFLDGAVKAAKVLASWVYLWDVPMPNGTLLAQSGFRSTGWAGCDVIASGSYLDNEFLEFTGDLVVLAHLSGEEELFDVAELVEYGMQHALSTPRNSYGYIANGIQCEGVLTSYWLSRPDRTLFSGAVNKVKGDDNDTCNALINGQAAYGMYTISDRYGTLDFDSLRQQLFAPESPVDGRC